MCDKRFDLSQALESSSDSDSRPKEFDMKHCSQEAKGVGLEEEQFLDCDLHAEEFCKMSMRQVATLVMVLHRMKCEHTPQSSEFTDDQLYSIIMENLVEESVVVKVEECTVHAERRETYIRMRGMTQCSLRDRYQKDMIYFSGAVELQAITLQGGTQERKVKFNLSTYLSARASTQGRVIALTIANTNWNLSCCMKKGSPTLHLEVFNEKELKEIKAADDLVRFLFCKRTGDMSLDTFESVKYPGWYISTSLEDRLPVEMCLKGTAHRLTYFKETED